MKNNNLNKPYKEVVFYKKGVFSFNNVCLKIEINNGVFLK